MGEKFQHFSSSVSIFCVVVFFALYGDPRVFIKMYINGNNFKPEIMEV